METFTSRVWIEELRDSKGCASTGNKGKELSSKPFFCGIFIYFSSIYFQLHRKLFFSLLPHKPVLLGERRANLSPRSYRPLSFRYNSKDKHLESEILQCNETVSKQLEWSWQTSMQSHCFSTLQPFMDKQPSLPIGKTWKKKSSLLGYQQESNNNIT